MDSRRVLLTDGTTGLCSWPAAWCLAEFAFRNEKFFESKSILELGAGIGLGGIVLASSLNIQKPLYLTDVHSEVLQIGMGTHKKLSLLSVFFFGKLLNLTEYD